MEKDIYQQRIFLTPKSLVFKMNNKLYMYKYICHFYYIM